MGTMAELVTGKATVELKVEGLCCTECAVAVEKALAHRAGVQQFRILTAAEKVQVDFDLRRVNAEEVARSIAALGYKVHPVGAPAAPAREPAFRLKMDTVRFAFVALVALIALLEVGGESLGWFEAVKARIPLPVLLVTIALGGYPIFRRAFLGLLHRQINVDTMMSVGILGAAALGQYTASMLIVFFMNIAHYLEDFTTGKSRRAIQELIRLSPKTARIKVDGREIEVAVEALKPGDIVAIRPGEQIPADGVVDAGLSSVNQASITGESLPAEKQPGDEVYAATFNELGYIEVRVTRVGPDTTFGKIVKLVDYSMILADTGGLTLDPGTYGATETKEQTYIGDQDYLGTYIALQTTLGDKRAELVVEGTAHQKTSLNSRVRVQVECSASVSGGSLTVYLWNWDANGGAGEWQQVGSAQSVAVASGAGDTNYVFTSSDAGGSSPYIKTGDLTVMAKLKFTCSAGQPPGIYLDVVELGIKQ